MKEEMITSSRLVYIEKCPICKKEIKGFSKSQNKFNLRMHIRQIHKKGGED